MGIYYTSNSFDALHTDWKTIQSKVPSSSIFSSPEWTQTWWKCFGNGYNLSLGAVKDDSRIIGIAPLFTKDNVAYFIGSIDLCDYLDFVIEPGSEKFFFKTLLDNLARGGITSLDLAPLKKESSVLTVLVDTAKTLGWETSCVQEDVSLILDLPTIWEEYLQLLSRKQRHELVRKIRRLNETGEVNFRSSNSYIPKEMEFFLKLFRESREDKAEFLTPQREEFIKSVANVMSDIKSLRLNILEVNKSPIAATICFDYRNVVYLYNSGYNREYSWLSVGLISKALCIQDSIQRSKKHFDFLKGDEAYKYHLGGYEIPLYRCRISLSL
jgi:CelD/BcsL family acetyltransferase involved in cellulose biosynthesis